MRAHTHHMRACEMIGVNHRPGHGIQFCNVMGHSWSGHPALGFKARQAGRRSLERTTLTNSKNSVDEALRSLHGGPCTQQGPLAHNRILQRHEATTKQKSTSQNCKYQFEPESKEAEIQRGYGRLSLCKRWPLQLLDPSLRSLRNLCETKPGIER